MRLTFRKGFDPRRLTWGRPDSVPTAICSYCSGGLPEIPLMMWDDKGACIQLCDECVERWIEAVR